MKGLPVRMINVVCAKCGWKGERREETHTPCPRCKAKAELIVQVKKRKKERA